jgi:osmotically inducible protein OsmC
MATYTTEATATGGRAGRVTSSDGALDLTLGFPKEMGGDGKGNNPEQLFAMGYAACFTGAFNLVARKAGKKTDGAQITAVVGLTRSEGGLDLEVELKANVPGLSKEEVKELLETAHQVCPYSKATRGNIPVTLTVI